MASFCGGIGNPSMDLEEAVGHLVISSVRYIYGSSLVFVSSYHSYLPLFQVCSSSMITPSLVLMHGFNVFSGDTSWPIKIQIGSNM
jgi:hypothetical protein